MSVFSSSGTRRTVRRATAGLGALALGLTMATIASPAVAGKHDDNRRPWPARYVDLQVLGFNDFHGHLEAAGNGAVGEVAETGGVEYLAAKLDELRAGTKYSLTVSAGDNIGGSPALSGLFHDEPTIEALNALDLSVATVGNHEFDEGVDELLRIQDGGCHPADGCYFEEAPYAGADFRYLAANVVSTTTGKPVLPGYWVTKVNGIKVGFIGVTLEDTDTLVAAAGIEGYEFRDEVASVNRLVPVLKRQGVNAIVLLLHEGGSQNPPPGEVNSCADLTGPVVEINNGVSASVDAIFTGHTHMAYNCTLSDPAGKPRLVTSALSYGRVVTEMNLVLNKHTRDVVRAWSSATNHVVDPSTLTADPEQTAIIAKWMPLFEAAGNTPVGTITADIVRGGVGGSDRGVESPAGNLVADAQLWSTSQNGAQIAFMNPGGVRTDLTYAASGTEGDGVVTYGEAFAFQPFGNTLVTIPMTGAQVVSVLEDQCQPAGSSRPFLHLGVSEGLTYTINRTLEDVAGVSTCTSVTVTDVQLDGVALDPAATYRVTVNNFLADGGDNFTTFTEVDPALRADGGNDLLALTNYLGTFSPVAPPSTDRVTELY